MPLLPALDENSPVSPELVARCKRERGGQLLLLYRVLLNSEPVAEGWLKLFTAIRQQSQLSGRIRELATLRVAVLNKATYEFDAHRPFALKEGIPAAWIGVLETGAVPPDADVLDLAVIRYTDELTREATVKRETHEAVKAHLTDREMLELTVTVAGYNMVSRVLNALEIRSEP
jgi:alkylhydroperoxidase family enzyme